MSKRRYFDFTSLARRERPKTQLELDFEAAEQAADLDTLRNLANTAFRQAAHEHFASDKLTARGIRAVQLFNAIDCEIVRLELESEVRQPELDLVQ